MTSPHSFHESLMQAPPAPPLPPKAIGDSASTGDLPSRETTPAAATAPSIQTSLPTPPVPDEFKLPPEITSKSLEDLTYLLHSPTLLDAVFTAHHPTSSVTATALINSLTHNVSLASNLQSLERILAALRGQVSTQLLTTRNLERQWREKEKEMYTALQPFLPPALYNRLTNAVQEAEGLTEALQASFLEERSGEVGREGGRDVGDFVKEYRTMRRTYHLRKERKERWDEGRVGGWR